MVSSAGGASERGDRHLVRKREWEVSTDDG